MKAIIPSISLAVAVGFLTSCGVAGDDSRSAGLIPDTSRHLGQANLLTDAREPEIHDALASDQDIKIMSIQAWIDFMPGLGTPGTAQTRLQVRFLAPSYGCTTGDHFNARLVQGPDLQTIVIKRTAADPCGELRFMTEINHTVEGRYTAGKPVYMNGEEVPVFESIIN